MKKMLLSIAILIATNCLKSQTLDTTFTGAAVVKVDSIYFNIQDTVKTCWIGCKTYNDNLTSQAEVEYYCFDANRKPTFTGHYILSGADYKDWDATAIGLIVFTRNKYLKALTFK